MPSELIILGIDPGTTIMGFGIIRVTDTDFFYLQGTTYDGKIQYRRGFKRNNIVRLI